MGELIKGECPHCRQPVEFPAEGVGQTVPCPTCNEPFVLKPLAPPVPQFALTLAPPLVPQKPAPKSPEPAAATWPAQTPPKPKEPPQTGANPFDRAFAAFANSRELAGRSPTREQLARAWALVKFRKEGEKEPPTHAELVAALKEIFKEFRSAKASVGSARPDKAS